MSVASQINKVTYQANGVITKWPFSFPVLDSSHLQIVITDADDNETTLETNYSVDLDSSYVTYPLEGEALATGNKITLLRTMPVVQEVDLENQGNYNAETLEAEYDYLTMLIQQVQERTNRAILAPVSADNANDLYDEFLEQKDRAELYANKCQELYDTFCVECLYNGAEIGTPRIYKIGYQADGYLLMDGSEFDNEFYQDLATILGTNKVPDWLADPEIPEGWAWYIKAAHKFNTLGKVKILTVDATTLENSDAPAAVTYDDSTTHLHFDIPRGLKGDRGLQGLDGPVGPIGPQGLQGQMGARGAQGIQGSMGLQGRQGTKGDQGLQGFQGVSGIQGLRGPQGVQGPKGEKGDTGDPGPEGAAGPQGERGPDGIAPVGISFGAFDFDEDGHLLFNCYGMTNTDYIEPYYDDNGHIWLNVAIDEGEAEPTTTESGSTVFVDTKDDLPEVGVYNALYLAKDTNNLYYFSPVTKEYVLVSEGSTSSDPLESGEVTVYSSVDDMPVPGKEGVVYIDSGANVMYRWDPVEEVYKKVTADLDGYTIDGNSSSTEGSGE